MSKAVAGDNKKALVPKLRFPEFRDAAEWRGKPLGKLATFSSGGTPSKDNVSYWGGSIPWISASSMHDTNIAVSNSNVTENAIGNGTRISTAGNLLVLVRGSMLFKRVPIGIATRDVAFNQDVKSLSLYKEVDNHFLLYQLITVSPRIPIHKTGIGAGKIETSILAGLVIAVPELGEQQKIADCLSSLDALIAAHTDKLAALKTHKQGLLQQLFPRDGETVPRLRFPEFRNAREWQETTLSSQIELVSGQHLAPDAYAETGEIPYFTGPSDYSNTSNDVSKWTARSKNTARRGDILITVKGSGVGELLHLELAEVAMGRQLMAVRPRKTEGRNFLFQFLATQQARLSALAAGNLIPGLSRSDLLTLAVNVPSEAEEAKIGDCLTTLDTLITAQTDKLAALKQHKQGLLQQLFPTMDEAAA